MDVILTMLGEFESDRIGKALRRIRVAGQESPRVWGEVGAKLLDIVLLLFRCQLRVVARVKAHCDDLKILAWHLVALPQHVGHAIEERRAQPHAAEIVQREQSRFVDQIAQQNPIALFVDQLDIERDGLSEFLIDAHIYLWLGWASARAGLRTIAVKRQATIADEIFMAS